MEVVYVTATVESAGTTQEPAASCEERAWVIRAIIEETHCTPECAEEAFDLLASLVADARKNGGITRLTLEQLTRPSYKVLDQVMPHGQQRQENSAHDLLEKYLLDPSKETGLVHDEMEDCNPISSSYCALLVHMIVQ